MAMSKKVQFSAKKLNQAQQPLYKAETRLFTSSLFEFHPLSQAFIEIDNKSRELRLFV